MVSTCLLRLLYCTIVLVTLVIWQEVENAQEAFVSLLGQIKPESKLKFLEWVCHEYNPVISNGCGQNQGVIEEESTEPGT